MSIPGFTLLDYLLCGSVFIGSYLIIVIGGLQLLSDNVVRRVPHQPTAYVYFHKGASGYGYVATPYTQRIARNRPIRMGWAHQLISNQ